MSGRFQALFDGALSPRSCTLLVDSDIAQGCSLVEQLNRAEFKAELALDWRVARAALRANDYHSCVIVADLGEAAERVQLAALRRAALRVWILVLSELPAEQALPLAHANGADAVLSTPFALHDLTWRLSAFSLRARPSF